MISILFQRKSDIWINVLTRLDDMCLLFSYFECNFYEKRLNLNKMYFGKPLNANISCDLLNLYNKEIREN